MQCNKPDKRQISGLCQDDTGGDHHLKTEPTGLDDEGPGKKKELKKDFQCFCLQHQTDRIVSIFWDGKDLRRAGL